MSKSDLSPRESEIVELAADGLTNEAIALRLDLSVGTVNTYWLRIKLKTGGIGRTDTVLSIFKKRHEVELNQERVDWKGLEAILVKRQILDIAAEKERSVDLRTKLALLQLALDSIQSTAWATDQDLCLHMITNGELPSAKTGVMWDDGKSIYDVFMTDDKSHPAVAAHLSAMAGASSELRLSGEFEGMVLKVVPILDELDEVIGSISILQKVQ